MIGKDLVIAPTNQRLIGWRSRFVFFCVYSCSASLARLGVA
jgi:hypothetical protein